MRARRSEALLSAVVTGCALSLSTTGGFNAEVLLVLVAGLVVAGLVLALAGFAVVERFFFFADFAVVVVLVAGFALLVAVLVLLVADFALLVAGFAVLFFFAEADVTACFFVSLCFFVSFLATLTGDLLFLLAVFCLTDLVDPLLWALILGSALRCSMSVALALLGWSVLSMPHVAPDPSATPKATAARILTFGFSNSSFHLGSSKRLMSRS